MRITNKTDLPQAVVDAVTNDPYDRGDCDISATSLVGPPQIRQLAEAHWDELEEDAGDRIWALLGQAVHTILERAAPSDVAEQRLFAECNGHTISGQVDHMGLKNKTLTDYKVTSAWTAVSGVKPEWICQLNVYAWLCRMNGIEIENLGIVAFYRDWSWSRAMQSQDYPPSQVGQIPIVTWDQDFAQEYIEARLAKHFGEEYVPCTDEERWAKPEQWAVMKEGRKSALRVLESKSDAIGWAWDNGHLASYGGNSEEGIVDGTFKAGYYLEERPREYTRCGRYCLVSGFCPQYAKENDNAE